jgi:hypothetical protein
VAPGQCGKAQREDTIITETANPTSVAEGGNIRRVRGSRDDLLGVRGFLAVLGGLVAAHALVMLWRRCYTSH